MENKPSANRKLRRNKAKRVAKTVAASGLALTLTVGGVQGTPLSSQLLSVKAAEVEVTRLAKTAEELYQLVPSTNSGLTLEGIKSFENYYYQAPNIIKKLDLSTTSYGQEWIQGFFRGDENQLKTMTDEYIRKIVGSLSRAFVAEAKNKVNDALVKVNDILATNPTNTAAQEAKEKLEALLPKMDIQHLTSSELGNIVNDIDNYATPAALENIQNNGGATDPLADAKQTAKDDLAKVRDDKIAEINGQPATGMTQEEREAAIAQVNKEYNDGAAAIDKATDQSEIDTALNTAKDKIDAVNSSVSEKKNAALASIDDAVKSKKQEIDGRNDLTDEEKAAAKNDVDALATTAKNNINNATTNEAVEIALSTGLQNITNYTKEAQVKPEALNELKQAYVQKSDAINASNLSDADKEKLQEQLIALYNEYKDKINAETTTDKVREAKNIGVNAINSFKIESPTKKDAKDAIDAAATVKKAAIDGNNDLTQEEKEAAKQAVDNAADKAKRDIDEATTDENVEKAKNTGVDNINNVPVEGTKKAEAKAAVDKAAKDAIDAINSMTNLTEAEKNAATGLIQNQASRAKSAIDAADTDSAVDTAKQDGLTSIDGSLLAANKRNDKARLDEQAEQQKKAIDEDQELTKEEKDAAKEAVDNALNTAKNAVDAATTVEEANTETDRGVASIKAENGTPVVREAARQRVREAADAKREEIEASKTLTDEEREAALAEVDDLEAEYLAAIDAANTNDDVNAAADEGVAKIEAIDTVGKTKLSAIEAIKKAAEDKKKAIDASKTMTDSEKVAAKAKVDEVSKKAIDAINAGASDADVKVALDAGLKEIDAISTQGTKVTRVPRTGVETGLFGSLGLMMASLAGLVVFRKKKED